jgi:hypothetical protein
MVKMDNKFGFDLFTNDQASSAIQRIDDAVKAMLDPLEKTQEALKQISAPEPVEGLEKLDFGFGKISKNARDAVQFIGDIVPPLKMVTGLAMGLSGVAKVVNMVKDGMIDFGNSGYRIETTAKNISMTTDAFQKLTGAMRENGATSEEAENSIAALYQRANDAVNNRDNGFLALMASNGIGISKTKEGVADVNKLLDDMHGRLMNLSPALQAVFGNAAGLSNG